MRICPIQPSVYNTTNRITQQNNISCKSAKGALKGAGIGGLTIGGIALLTIGLPAALILGGISAGLSAIVGNEFENQNNSEDENNKNKSDLS